MKISTAIKHLAQIQEKFGDIKITGGTLNEDSPLSKICVTEKEGMEIWPFNPNGLDLKKVEVDGVFLV